MCEKSSVRYETKKNKNVSNVISLSFQKVFIVFSGHQASVFSGNSGQNEPKNGRKIVKRESLIGKNTPRYIENNHENKINKNNKIKSDSRAKNFLANMKRRSSLWKHIRHIRHIWFVEVLRSSLSRFGERNDRMASCARWNRVKLKYERKVDVRKLHEVKFNLIIKSNDVEMNPGPITNEYVDKNNLFICTYNAQGLGSFKKLKRFINQLHKLPFKNNCIINLQETHFKNEKSINFHWKHGSVNSFGTSNSAGVTILYNTAFFDEILDQFTDDEGRMCILVVQKSEEQYIFVNIYAPNDHYQSLIFFETVTKHINEMKDKYSSAQIVFSGDLNVIMDPNFDSIGRNQTKQEVKVVKKLTYIKKLLGLVDTYRLIHKYGGYTWGKNNPNFMRSRLDHIMATKTLTNSLATAFVTNAINESDHLLLVSEFTLSSLKYGPGIIRCNATLLDDDKLKMRVESRLKMEMENVPEDWTPHQKLDYFKFLTRSLLLKEGKERSKIRQTRLDMSNEEIDTLKRKLDNILATEDINKPRFKNEVEKLKQAIEIAEEVAAPEKLEESKRLIFRSKVKWAEEGEKSTKYFLNLVKERQKKMIIRKIISNGTSYYQQDEITRAINEFYKRLYEKQPELKPIDQNDSLFQNLPKLNESDRNEMSKNLTLDELHMTLMTCKESAPGSDGITYGVYKKLWSVAGKLILDSWDFSLEIGRCSTSQRESIITLLEKKGKDKTIISNLRPISLSNCDIKICTKSLALRTNKILSKLLNPTQTGYVPGRNVTNNNRLLEEIIKEYKEKGQQAYLITLDAQKAFDSVDHQYLIDILKIYNFPIEFIEWVKILYTELRSKVLVNGYTSDYFDINQSVKQGDALSCALFVLCVEPLLRRLGNNTNITPAKINNRFSIDDEILINNLSYADDITVITTDLHALQTIIDEYTNFSGYSGIKLNVSKTEVLIIGKQDKNKVVIPVKYKGNIINLMDQDKVTICGVCYSNDDDLAYEQNITLKIAKLEKQLSMWKQRNLSFEGKILIVKTFGLSQLIYSMQSTSVRNEDLRMIDDIIFRFIWNTKRDKQRVTYKIKKTILESSRDKGGIKAPNIFTLDKAIKHKAVFYNNKLYHPIMKLYESELRNRGCVRKSYYAPLCRNDFIGNAIEALKDIGNNIKKDIELLKDDGGGIHKEYYGYMQNMNLYHSNFMNPNQRNLVDRLVLNNINTVGDVINEKLNPRLPNLFFEVHMIYNTIPRSWRVILGTTARRHRQDEGVSYVNLNKWKDTQKVGLMDLKVALKGYNDMCIKTYLEVKHNTIEIDNIVKNPFGLLYRFHKDVKLRSVQYRILHNIYPTMKHLYTWKIKLTPLCAVCNEEETLRHAIFDCRVARKARKSLETYLESKINVRLVLTYENVLFGLTATKTNYVVEKNLQIFIDKVLICLKQKLILQREEKYYIEEEEIKNLVKERLLLEYKVNKQAKYWGYLRTLKGLLIDVI